jgi:cytochrome c peroxidase
MNHHHGMQSVERFGDDVDADQDGVANELSVGDITAIAVFQAALGTPGRKLSKHEARRKAADRGELLFDQIGCIECHVPLMTLDSPLFTEPNPFNLPSNLRVGDVLAAFAFDMTTDGIGPRLEKSTAGGAVVHAFTDLKRHNLNDEDYNFFGNEQLPQGKLNGFAPASDFTVELPPRSTGEFLTRKLWDVGNTAPYGHRGDLTTMTGAIHYHGGEARKTRDAYFGLEQKDQDAIIEFLKTLQVLTGPSM